MSRLLCAQVAEIDISLSRSGVWVTAYVEGAGSIRTVKCANILIIEDEAFIRENLQMLFELEGYSVQTAENGKEGLAVLNKTVARPCMILLDLLMPVMNGFEFLKAKNTEASISDIPVCVLSGSEDEPRLENVAALVRKPFGFEELLQAVQLHASCA
jgi:CheY-like chemotaxis protein